MPCLPLPSVLCSEYECFVPLFDSWRYAGTDDGNSRHQIGFAGTFIPQIPSGPGPVLTAWGGSVTTSDADPCPLKIYFLLGRQQQHKNKYLFVSVVGQKKM